jgi:hypothetical protein
MRGPQAFGNSWPQYAREWEDLLAQAGADAEQLQQDARQQNRVRIRPSSVEIMRMEIAIAWPARYLAAFPQLLRIVGAVAIGRSRDRDIAHIARRRLKRPPRVVRQLNREGLDLIAAGLRRDCERVF